MFKEPQIDSSFMDNKKWWWALHLNRSTVSSLLYNDAGYTCIKLTDHWTYNMKSIYSIIEGEDKKWFWTDLFVPTKIDLYNNMMCINFSKKYADMFRYNIVWVTTLFIYKWKKFYLFNKESIFKNSVTGRKLYQIIKNLWV